jgi:hypothetical protein
MTMRPLIPLLFSTLVGVCFLGCFSGCGRGGKDSPTATQPLPELVDARKYLPNAPVGAMIHMPLTAAAAQYAGKTGRFPVSLEELVSAGIIQKVPEAPASTRFFLDQNSMQVLVLPK